MTTTDQTTTTTTPVPVEVTADHSRGWERALAAVKDIIVITTCLAVLYVLWLGYTFVVDLGRTLQNFSDTFGTGL